MSDERVKIKGFEGRESIYTQTDAGIVLEFSRSHNDLPNSLFSINLCSAITFKSGRLCVFASLRLMGLHWIMLQ